MSCQARKKKGLVFSMARGCRVSSQGCSPWARELITGKHVAPGFPGTRQPPLLPRGCSPPPTLRTSAPGRAAPPTAWCPLQASREHFNQRCPLLGPPSPGSTHPRDGWGHRRERSQHVSSPCCVTLESFPALSGWECRKWKCEANQTRCDYF